MKKPVSVRRQKKVSNPSVALDTKLIVEPVIEQQLQAVPVLSDQHLMQEQLSVLITKQQKVAEQFAEMQKLQAVLNTMVSALKQDVSDIKKTSLTVTERIQSILNKLEHITLLENILSEVKQLKSIGKDDLKSILNILLNKKQDIDTERTISFQLGKTLINGAKSVEGLIKLPGFLYDLRKESDDRKNKKKLILDNVQKIKNVTLSESADVLEKSKQVAAPVLKSIVIDVVKNENQKLLKNFTKALTLLDPISELCWKDGFPGFAISRSEFLKQIENTTSDFAFFESAWKANKSSWLYAFNSPNLQHANAQDLLKVIGLLRRKKIPVVFWNKEDPMHYEMFKPIAKEADFVFTTDSLKIDQYKKDLGHNFVWALPFAAPVKLTNPINRFKLDTETVCFAGTYYAKNHPDRKKQMDMLLPALLSFNGAIYDRASSTNSENYLFPEQYRGLIRDGVEFQEMIQLYKKFKVFLNVNTITQSPTMMSRRVYELLASGTPVVSTPSKAITEQFPGIVLTVRNEEEAKKAVQKLTTDSYFWNKQSVLGIREVMSKHTYGDRWSEIKSLMQDKKIKQCPNMSVSVVAKYHGYQDFDAFIQNIIQQTILIEKIKIFVASNSFNEILDSALKYNNLVQVSRLDAFNKNESIAEDKEGYTFFTTDSVMLFKNCIKDMILSFKYHEGYATCRKNFYSLKKLNLDNNLSLPEGDWYTYFSENDLDCVVVKNIFKSKINLNFDTSIMKISNQDNKIFQIDPFNIVRVEKVLKNSSLIEVQDRFKYQYSSRLGV